MWYYNYIQHASWSGVVSGDIDGRFRPNDIITRGEAAKIFINALDVSKVDYTGTFADV